MFFFPLYRSEQECTATPKLTQTHGEEKQSVRQQLIHTRENNSCFTCANTEAVERKDSGWEEMRKGKVQQQQRNESITKGHHP